MWRYLGEAEAAGHVDQILERIGLAEKAAAFPHELSGGMQRKLGICLALVSMHVRMRTHLV